MAQTVSLPLVYEKLRGRLRSLSFFRERIGLRWRRWLQEPLIHFFGAGLLLFAAHALFGKDAPSAELDIRVNEAALLQFVQFRAKVFSEPQARAHLHGIDSGARAQLIQDFIREEALYREALAWGLDQSDYVIRRRLVQSLEFAARSAGNPELPFHEAALQDYYKENQERYVTPPSISFTHIFFSADQHGWAEARHLARQALAMRNGDLATVGDRFLYHRNYVAQQPDLIAGHFGASMAKRLFALEANPGRWQGPLRSPFGMHLVRVTERRAQSIPPLRGVRDTVVQDLQEARAETEQRRILDGIIARYRVHVDPDLIGGK